ncbi:hypothetical protein CSC2_35520 [Clostridium zeae]|uniref:DUF4163 domain-containing protein n=1 Tax=Clostridium zeae TaxID=2759022 RepID=A0ABQ1EE37_9CLOT|nr:hypothetical protein [Clostridium zeae]GFZ33026.1 hypothetical protein CSC2_35520 [Clostridium zeae]
MNKKVKYSLITLLTGLTVAFTVLFPDKLLKKEEKSLLGNSHIVDNSKQMSSNNLYTASGSTNQPNSTNAAQNRTTEFDREVAEKVNTLKKYSANNSLAREISSDSMSMREAVALCINKISMILSKNPTLNLNEFPDAYSVNGELRTIEGKNLNNGKVEFQYWNINFNGKTDKNSTRQGIEMLLDAKTGVILSMSIIFENKVDNVDLERILQSIGDVMNFKGGVLSFNSQKGSQTAIWGGKDSPIIIKLIFGQEKDLTFLKMNLDVKSEVTSAAPIEISK